MRNIYDIIYEQKLMVDVNMASYDLQYVSEHFMDYEDNYYLAEGFGDKVKNIVQKIIDFIKKLIEKVRNLIQRVVNFFRGKKNYTKTWEEDIGKKPKSGGNNNKTDQKSDENKVKQSSGGSIGSANPEQKRMGEAPSNKSNENKPNNNSNNNAGNAGGAQYEKMNDYPKSFEEILRGSKRTVQIVKYVGLKEKENFMDTFMSVFQSVTGNFASGNYDHANDKVFMNTMLNKCFKGKGSYKSNPDPNLSVVDRIQLELNEPNEKVSMKVSDNYLIKIIVEYAETEQIERNLKGQGDKVESNLNKIKAKLEAMKNGGKDIAQSNFNNIQRASSMCSSFVNYMVSNIVGAYNACKAIVDQVENDFNSVNSHLGGVDLSKY